MRKPAATSSSHTPTSPTTLKPGFIVSLIPLHGSSGPQNLQDLDVRRPTVHLDRPVPVDQYRSRLSSERCLGNPLELASPTVCRRKAECSVNPSRSTSAGLCDP